MLNNSDLIFPGGMEKLSRVREEKTGASGSVSTIGSENLEPKLALKMLAQSVGLE